MNKKIIVITGFQGHGKDYVTKLFIKELASRNITTQVVKASSPLIDFLSDLFMIDEVYFSDYKDWYYSDTEYTYRDLMKMCANQFVRKVDNTVFIRHVINQINNSTADVIIFNDLRDLNDYEIFKPFFRDYFINYDISYFSVERKKLLPRLWFNLLDMFSIKLFKVYIANLIQLFYPKYRYPESGNFYFREEFNTLPNNENVEHNVKYYVNQLFDENSIILN